MILMWEFHIVDDKQRAACKAANEYLEKRYYERLDKNFDRSAGIAMTIFMCVLFYVGLIV